MQQKFGISDDTYFTIYDGLGNIVMQGNSKDFKIKTKLKEDINNMEQFNLKKHWNKFRNGELVVNCKTEELANEFLLYCHIQGITWCMGKYLLSGNNWDVYKEETCYSNYCGFTYANVNHFKFNCRIVEFTGFNNESKDDTNNHTQRPKPQLGVMPKHFYEFQRVQDLCRALYERSIFEEEEIDYDLMIKWSDELNDRLYGLKEDKLYKEVEDADDCSWDNQ